MDEQGRDLRGGEVEYEYEYEYEGTSGRTRDNQVSHENQDETLNHRLPTSPRVITHARRT